MLLCRMAPCMLQKKRTWAPLNNPILHGVSHSKTPTKEQSTERATEPLKTTPGEEKTNDSAQRSPWVGEDSNKQKNHQKKKKKTKYYSSTVHHRLLHSSRLSLSLSLPPQIQQDRRGEHSPHAVKRPLSLHPPPPTSPKTSTSTAKFAKEFKHSKGHGCRRGAPPLNRHAAGSRRRVPAFFRSRPPPSPSLGNGLLPPSLPVGAATRLSIAGWLASCSVMLISGRGVLCRLLGLGELVHADL